MTATIIYKGELRCESTHLQSGTIIESDAPTDNKGKGEKFSPTDLLCVSLGTCVITTMGIKAADMNVNLEGTKLEVTKEMVSDPRRVGRVIIKVVLPQLEISEKDKLILQRTGDNCPVHKSLHPDLQKEITYEWG